MKLKTYAEINNKDICINLFSFTDDDIAFNPEKTLIEVNSKESILGKRYVNGEWQEIDQPIVEPEPTQLDRIEATIQQNYAEAQQEGADTITLELIERGVI